jgi:hypothetical protein
MRDELVQKLGRFDSVVEAHKKGDRIELLAAVDKNIAVHQAIVDEAQRTIDRYSNNLHLLIALANDVEAEMTSMDFN